MAWLLDKPGLKASALLWWCLPISLPLREWARAPYCHGSLSDKGLGVLGALPRMPHVCCAFLWSVALQHGFSLCLTHRWHLIAVVTGTPNPLPSGMWPFLFWGSGVLSFTLNSLLFWPNFFPVLKQKQNELHAPEMMEGCFRTTQKPCEVWGSNTWHSSHILCPSWSYFTVVGCVFRLHPRENLPSEEFWLLLWVPHVWETVMVVFLSGEEEWAGRGGTKGTGCKYPTRD